MCSPTGCWHQSTVPRYGVLNQGIAANRVLTDRYPGDGVSTDSGGVSALHRVDRDVLAQTSARTAIVFQGVNDLRTGAAAADVIAGLRELADRVRARGLRVLVATIGPCGGEARCTSVVDGQRVAVNTWIREEAVSDGGFDGCRGLRRGVAGSGTADAVAGRVRQWGSPASR